MNLTELDEAEREADKIEGVVNMLANEADHIARMRRDKGRANVQPLRNAARLADEERQLRANVAEMRAGLKQLRAGIERRRALLSKAND